MRGRHKPSALVRQPSYAPTRKVSGAMAGYFAASIVVWVLERRGVEIPDNIGIAVEGLGTYLGGWLPKERVLI